ncbi:hypothetical protein CAP35_02705 [Chitinophagaceae bacterium IBVUCB1]|nr:hypothetical protein CAP35_02705 [Chitinophagaceae bacterium IBVUCB1]
MRKAVFFGIIMLTSLCAGAQGGAYEERAKSYIEQYKHLAVAEQKRSGIPAAITLAQGIHETSAGSSELATMANNHFGIKCKKEWTGETFAHTDDAPNECFRKYSRAEDSYKDHSDYLMKSPRYAELFKLSITDYAAWAVGLKRCGYATNPRYAQMLIKIVEDYKLQAYTYAALNDVDINAVSPDRKAEVIPEEDAREMPQQQAKGMTAGVNNTPAKATQAVAKQPKPVVAAPQVTSAPVVVPVTTAPAVVSAPPTNVPEQEMVTEVQEIPVAESTGNGFKPAYGQMVRVNGLKAVYARKGDTPLEYAYKTSFRYQKLLELNEIDERPLPNDMYLYLERKNTRGVRPKHVVKSGETTYSIAQAEGLQLKSLMDMNMLQPGEEPYPGTVLELQQYRTSKPVVVIRKKETPVIYTKPTAYPQAVPVAANSATVSTKPAIKTSNIVVNENSVPAAEKIMDTTVAKPIIAPAKTEVAATVATQPVVVKEPVVVAEMKKDTVQQAVAVVTQPTITAPAVPAPVEAAPVVAIQAEAKPVAIEPAAPVAVTTQAIPVPVVETTPIAKDTAIAIQAAPIVEETKPLPTVNIEPVAAVNKPAALPTSKPVAAVVKPVEVPVIEEEPKDELDRLKKKFDKVVYAKDNVRTTPPPAQPVATTIPKPDTIKAVTTAPKPEEKIKPLAPSSDASKYYIVKKGDTGFAIAQKYGISVKQLNEWNGLNFGAIQEGQKLRIKP